MLVLSRKKQESIRIGDDIEVVVLEVARNRVRLGFRCPPHVSITRSELLIGEQESGERHEELVAELAMA
jgi:carbon storage regulator